MNLLRKKLEIFLINKVLKGVEALDCESLCAKALKRIDVKDVFKQDISRICQAVSINEITQIFFLTERMKFALEDEKREAKKKVKKLAENVVARVENSSGKFKLPEPCRHLLLKL